jgi:hypothetical protein
MTTQTQNTTAQNENKYYDMQSKNWFAYLYRFRVVNPKAGQKFKPFCSVTLAVRRGLADDNEFTYIDTKIFNNEICDLLKEHAESIEDNNVSVYGTVTVSDMYPDLYTDKDGVVRPVIKGRLISMSSLGVNGQIVFTKAKAPASEGTNEPAAQAEEPVQEAPVAGENLEPEVELDVNDPNFEARKTELKELGYEWSSAKKLWVLPTAA